MLANKPESESARLAELHGYGVLDTAPESDFDDVVGLVARLLDAPVALISLVDADRQWFKATAGYGGTETPLNQSICAHAILGDDLLEIPDTLADKRTADNPICCGPLFNMRFYAGALLVSPSGHKLGTLCVLDDKPRQLTELQRDTLRIMARQVTRQLDLCRALHTETVLRDEIDHRVKNSLQTVNSLVRLYRTRAKQEETRDVLEAVERRVTAVAELHTALYQSEKRSEIDLRDYLSRVVALLELQSPEGVHLRADLAAATVTPDRASAIAVIVNEFVANTFKHAFPKGGPGEVVIRVTSDDRGIVVMCTDNGPGIHAESPQSSRGIGQRLMEAAAEQLGGEMEIGASTDGYRLRLLVPDHPDMHAASAA